MHFEKMELKDKDISISDDEEDLEQLRFAALQSLRKPAMANNAPVRAKPKKLSPPSLSNRGRSYQGRNIRNGQYSNRSRNANLISIPTVQTEDLVTDAAIPTKRLKFGDNDTVSKLVLPQDRYCNVQANEEKSAEPVSKFDRYDNSDKSESETENEFESNSENECDQPKLERADSLEALMQELENEIQGDSKPKEDKAKKRVKKRKRKVSCPDPIDSSQNDACVVKAAVTTAAATENVAEEKDKPEIKFDKTKSKLSKLDGENEKSSVHSHLQRSVKSRSTMQRKSPLYDRYKRQYYDPSPKINYPQQNMYPLVFPPNLPFNNQPVLFHPVLPYNPQFPGGNQVPPGDMQHNFIPSFSERSLSPLSLNTDDALNIARAPLSPRSAAFVLQNREIIERRKKSPRRSYSRSPSPRYRRSKSPRNYNGSPTSTHQKFFKLSRSPTPNPQQKFSPNYDKGVSPVAEKKLSPMREKRLSPKYASPPRERRHSPYRQKRLSPARDKKISPSRDTKLIPARDRKLSPNRDRKSPVREKRPSPLRDKRPSPTEDHPLPNRRNVADRKSPVLNKSAANEPSPKQNYRAQPKTSIRDRLGSRSHFNDAKNSSTRVQQSERKVKKCNRSVSPSPSPEPSTKEVALAKQNYLDPILEARRRKFESNEIKNTEGIIRLKPKTTDPVPREIVEMQQVENVSNEEEILDVDVDILDTKVDDLFSDEETDEENEGRFKCNANKRSVSVLPFTQLLSNSAQNVKNEGLSQERSENRKRDRRKNSTKDRHEKCGGRSTTKTNKEGKTAKSTSKIDEAKGEQPSEKRDAKEKSNLKSSRLAYRSEIKRDKVLPIENKKIEIKIRNPAKYETTSKYDVANEHEIERVSRKVEAAGKAEKEESDLHENEPEIIIDNEDDADLTSESEGDLRAQLSRKRAERQNKHPVAEDVQSRLLQSALQGAVFKKPKKSKKSSKEPVSKDGKLPIHLRLGFANDVDAFAETVSHKKNRKNKSSGGLEQV